jgi:hypothetical protein
MGTSGNPAKKAEQLQISQVGDFKKRLGGVMQLPSGVVVKVKNPGGMRAFLTTGLIPNSLMGVIKEALEGKGTEEFTGKEFLNEEGGLDTDTMNDMMALLDSIAVKCIVQPKVHAVPTTEDLLVWNVDHPDEQLDDPDELRDEEKLYADELPEDDKMFIFQWLTGGTNDLATFREGQEQNMGAVAQESSARAAAKRGSGSNKR